MRKKTSPKGIKMKKIKKTVIFQTRKRMRLGERRTSNARPCELFGFHCWRTDGTLFVDRGRFVNRPYELFEFHCLRTDGTLFVDCGRFVNRPYDFVLILSFAHGGDIGPYKKSRKNAAVHKNLCTKVLKGVRGELFVKKFSPLGFPLFNSSSCGSVQERGRRGG